MAEAYLLESGTDKYLLEDSSGVLLLDPRLLVEQDTSNNQRIIFGTQAAQSNQAAAQSFSFAVATTITSVELSLNKVLAPADNMVLDVVSTLGGSSLATCSVAAASVSTSEGYVVFALSVPVACTAGITYYLQLTRSGARDVTNYFQWWSNSGGSTYAGGATWGLGSTGWTTSATEDMRFRIYGNENPARSLVVGSRLARNQLLRT